MPNFAIHNTFSMKSVGRISGDRKNIFSEKRAQKQQQANFRLSEKRAEYLKDANLIIIPYLISESSVVSQRSVIGQKRSKLALFFVSLPLGLG